MVRTPGGLPGGGFARLFCRGRLGFFLGFLGGQALGFDPVFFFLGQAQGPQFGGFRLRAPCALSRARPGRSRRAARRPRNATAPGCARHARRIGCAGHRLLSVVHRDRAHRARACRTPERAFGTMVPETGRRSRCAARRTLARGAEKRKCPQIPGGFARGAIRSAFRAWPSRGPCRARGSGARTVRRSPAVLMTSGGQMAMRSPISGRTITPSSSANLATVSRRGLRRPRSWPWSSCRRPVRCRRSGRRRRPRPPADDRPGPRRWAWKCGLTLATWPMMSRDW